MADLSRLLRSQELQKAGTTGITAPTAANPVVSVNKRAPLDFTQTTASRIARPEDAQSALTESSQRGAFDVARATPSTQTQAEADIARREDVIRGGTLTPRTERTDFSQVIGGSDADNARSRAFFTNMRDQGLSIQDLMDATGATTGKEAAAIARGLTGLGAEDQALVDENLAILAGQRATEKEEARFLTEEEKIRADVAARFAPEFTKAREGGERARETSLRVAGRAAQGTKSEEQQQLINEKQQEIEQSIAAQQRLEERQQLAIARGASGEELDSIKASIQSAKDKRVAIQDELALKQAGLDEAAIERSEFNTKMMLDALEAGFEYDPESNSFTAQEGKTKIDQNVSKLLGFASDEFGNPVTGADGNPLEIDKDNNTEWGSFQDKYGNTVFFDKSNPANTRSPGSSQAYTNQSGDLASSETSDVSGVQTVGQGEPYTRDNGTQGFLGENCVKWAREQVPNLPFGLFNKKDKQDAINLAVDEGFGGRGGSGAQVGDAILTGEGSVGHAAVVVGIDPQTGDLILGEANYTPGEVTSGRTISANDPSIYGFITTTRDRGQMNSVINEDAVNEGTNPAISTQVIVESGEVPQQDFSRIEDNKFKQFEKNFKLPIDIDNHQEETQFLNDYAVWSKQQEDKGFELEPKDKIDLQVVLRKEFRSAIKEPQKALTQINIMEESMKEAEQNAKGGDLNAASQGILVTFQKILDPTSVVRESEYARTGDGQALLDRMEGAFQTMQQGGAGVTIDTLRNFMSAARRFQTGYEASIIDEASPIMNDVTKNNLDRNSIFSPDVLSLIERGPRDAETEELKANLSFPTEAQAAEIDAARASLESGELLIMRKDNTGQFKFTAITQEELLPTDIEL